MGEPPKRKPDTLVFPRRKLEGLKPFDPEAYVEALFAD